MNHDSTNKQGPGAAVAAGHNQTLKVSKSPLGAYYVLTGLGPAVRPAS
jgi:hypothetical protein